MDAPAQPSSPSDPPEAPSPPAPVTLEYRSQPTVPPLRYSRLVIAGFIAAVLLLPVTFPCIVLSIPVLNRNLALVILLPILCLALNITAMLRAIDRPRTLLGVELATTAAGLNVLATLMALLAWWGSSNGKF